jgi:GNAT superfamily N-acetyltransferase
MIRRATAADAGLVADILRDAFAQFETLYTPLAFRATVMSAVEVAQRLDEGPVWVALLEHRPAGTVSAVSTAEGCYLRSLAVAPGARGRGVGASLVHAVEQFARSEGHREVVLSTTPFLGSAIRLYERCGFSRRGGGPSSLHGTPLLTMRKRLSDRKG